MDYHLETAKPVIDVNLQINRVELKVGESSFLSMKIKLQPHKPYLEVSVSVDWKERHKFLKVKLLFSHGNKATGRIVIE